MKKGGKHMEKNRLKGKYYTLHDIAVITGYPWSTLRRWAQQGKLPQFQKSGLSGWYLIPVETLADFLQELKKQECGG